jgi:hypothetical protein
MSAALARPRVLDLAPRSALTDRFPGREDLIVIRD